MFEMNYTVEIIKGKLFGRSVNKYGLYPPIDERFDLTMQRLIWYNAQSMRELIEVDSEEIIGYAGKEIVIKSHEFLKPTDIFTADTEKNKLINLKIL